MGALPLIVDVKRNSLEDGPGIRSVVFFKGCPLRCVFCHNPETWSKEAEIVHSASECLSCGACADACPERAQRCETHGLPLRTPACRACGACVEACPGKGLRWVGAHYSVEALTELLLRDRVFYRYSGGGVTLSGGECTQYPSYLELLLTNLKQRGVHVVLETCGFFEYRSFREKVLPYLDLVYFDLKFADPALHKRHTGRSNALIQRNLARLAEDGRVPVVPRIPLIPGLTATEDNLSGLAHILRTNGFEDALLLPYNPLEVKNVRERGVATGSLPEHFMSLEEEETYKKNFHATMERERERTGRWNSGYSDA